MPFSSSSGKGLVDRAIIRLIKQAPELLTSINVLDIGAGSGTYSDRYSKTWLKRNEFRWIGVEVWAPYVEKYNLMFKYDAVKNIDAREYFADHNVRYGICFMGDVLEHMTREEASKLVDQALDHCDVVILSIPIGHYPQDEYDGNPFEKHVVDNWTMDEAKAAFTNICFYGQDQEIGVLICSRKAQLYRLLKPQVGVYAICKNEEAFIERMLDSVEAADFIVICDTGSTDSTMSILNERQTDCFIAKQISVSPWRFDDARNCALFSLPEEIDVCVSIDGDEMMAHNPKNKDEWYDILTDAVEKDLQQFGKPRDRYNHRFMTHWNWTDESAAPQISEHWHERIHSRQGYMWKLPVHEILVKSVKIDEPETIEWLHQLMMVQKPDTTKSRSSYLPLLEISVQEDPKRWKSWSFMAGEYINQGNLEKAIGAIETAMQIDNSDKAYLSYQASTFYQHHGKFNKAVLELMNAIEFAPALREYRCYLAKLYHSRGQFVEEHEILLEAAKITERSYGYEYNPACWGEEFEAQMTRCELMSREDR